MPQQIEQIRRIAFDQQELGMGFNSDTGQVVGTALDFDAPTPQGAQEASSSASIVTTHDAVMNALNMSFEAEGRYALSSASLKAEFSRSTTYNSVSTFVVARMVVQNQIARGRNFRVKPEAAELLETNQHDTFQAAFGDSFVRGRLSGGEFYAVIRITSFDTSVQQSLGVTLQAEINGGIGAGGFAGQFQTANSSSKTRSEFNVVFYQRGGSGAEQIGTTLTVDEIKDRLRELPTAIAANPFPYEVELATYDTIPLATPPKFQADAFVAALADANKRHLDFLEKRNDFEFAAERQEFFEDPPPAPECLAAAAVFLRAANAALAHAVRLARGEIDPPQFFDVSAVEPPIVLPVLSLRKKSLEHRAFRDWYVIRDDPAITQDDHMMVTAIAAVAAEEINDFAAIPTEAAKGEALEPVVARFEKINLAQIDVFENEQIVKLKGIEHLCDMLPTRLVELDVGHNAIANLKGLERFTKLRHVRLAGNAIDTIVEVGGLPELQEIDVSDNRIVDVSPLRTCAKLDRVVLSKNRIADLGPLAALPLLSSLVVDGALLGVNPEFVESLNPVAKTAGLEHNAALANPFLTARRLKVRLGTLSQGPAAQFTGTAERIGETLRYRVELTRGAEAITDEWTLSQINSRPDTVFGRPEGSQMLVLFVRSLGHSVFTWSEPEDRPNAIIDRDETNTEPSIDATPLA
jgi:hypothetical protein